MNGRNAIEDGMALVALSLDRMAASLDRVTASLDRMGAQAREDRMESCDVLYRILSQLENEDL